jgi:hypothetical protein
MERSIACFGQALVRAPMGTSNRCRIASARD